MTKKEMPASIIDIPVDFNLSGSNDCPKASLRSYELDDIDRDYDLSLHLFYAVAENSKVTFNAHRRELERVLQWSWHVRKTNAYSLPKDDIRFTSLMPVRNFKGLGRQKMFSYVTQ